MATPKNASRNSSRFNSFFNDYETSSNLLKIVFENTSDLCIVMDREWRCRYLNPSA